VFYSVEGTVTGVAGTIVIQNNLGDDITFDADGSYSYIIIGGFSYSITVTGQACTINNSFGTPTADVTDVNITCT